MNKSERASPETSLCAYTSISAFQESAEPDRSPPYIDIIRHTRYICTYMQTPRDNGMFIIRLNSCQMDSHI